MDETDSSVDVDIQIYQQGWTGHRLYQNGMYRTIVATLKGDGAEVITLGKPQNLLKIDFSDQFLLSGWIKFKKQE